MTNDSAARDNAVASSGSVLVQAPAGSGKTTLLVQRYLRLLSVVDAPERILALTFTRRAAEEMRERVIAALAAAGTGSHSEPDSLVNGETLHLAVTARRHLLARQIDVERQPSRLRIETIDSFNAWLSAQLPVTSGAGGRLALEEHARPMYEEAARRALDYAGRDSFGAAVERVLAIGDQRWRQLIESVSDMLASRDRWLPLLAGRLQAASPLDEAQLAYLRRVFDEDLELLVTRALRTAYDVIGGERVSQLSCLARAVAGRVTEPTAGMLQWRAARSTLSTQPEDIERWRAIAAMCLTAAGKKLRSGVNVKNGFPPGCAEKQPMIDLLAEFKDRPAVRRALSTLYGLPASRYGDADWERVRDVAQVLVLAAAELEQVFRERGSVDFPAVSMAGLRALGSGEAPTDLGLRLDYRLQHLLLDEFQDTSSAQLELVRLLTAGWQRGDGRSIFCVGDPMQSIYGFRQAEVRAFLELAEVGMGEVEFSVERLTSNFRSHQGLVDWVNKSFSAIMPQSDDRERGAIAFRPSRAVRGATTSSGPAVAVHGFATPAAEATAIAELIAARRREQSGWRIAILVRARAHAREIAAALRMREIEFRAVDIEPLRDRPAVRDLIMLACALLHWGDRTAWLAVLRAPWTGLRLADLLRIAGTRRTIWEALGKDVELARLSEDGRERCLRLRQTLRQVFGAQNQTSVTRWIERAWLAVGGPSCARDARELEDAGAVFSRLRELEQRGMPDAAELAASFDDLYAGAGPPSAVEIMTIHKSKGLEFDLVILPGLNRPSRTAGTRLLLLHEFARTGRDGMVIGARPAIGAEPNQLFEFLRGQARDAAALEAERLLYVACTRAKLELHLTATIEQPDNASVDAAEGEDDVSAAAPKARGGTLLDVLWPQIGAEFLSNMQPASGTRTDPELLRGGPLRRVPVDWAPPAYAAEPSDVLGAVEPGEELPVFDWAGETARRVGTLVHAELQRLDLTLHDEAHISAREGHFRRWLALHGVPEERLSQASARAVAALLGVVRDPEARWIFRSGYRDDYREHALSGRWRGEVVRAVFDRTFIDEQGVRWVIDYKTSQHTGGALDEFLQREVERYRPQLERYAALASKLGPERVRVGLYFPLMAAWRAWDP